MMSVSLFFKRCPSDLCRALWFFADPGMIAMYALLIAVPMWAGKASARLAPWEQKAANWFLLNGAVFHFFMDGLCGTFGYGGQLAIDYHKLDSRFAHGDPYLKVVTGMELFLYTPLCFLAYRAIVRGLPSRGPLVIITSVCHLFGLFVFAGGELVQGCAHIPATDSVGPPCFSNIKWPPTENQFTFFWFGFVLCNIPWVVVPIRLTLGAYDDIVAAGKAKSS